MVLLFIILLDSIWVLLLIVPVDYALFHTYTLFSMLDCSVIIVDDVMYANIMPEDLPLFYRAVSFLNEERSLIIITNRELSGWINAAEDTHLMQTLVDRITANSQIIRL